MEDLEQLIAQRDTLERMRYRGTSSVRGEDWSVEYRSDDELRQALADLNRKIDKARGGGISTVRFSSVKGV